MIGRVSCLQHVFFSTYPQGALPRVFSQLPHICSLEERLQRFKTYSSLLRPLSSLSLQTRQSLSLPLEVTCSTWLFGRGRCGGQRPRITAEVNCLGGRGPKRGHVSLRSRPGSPLKVMMGTAASMSSSYEATWKMTSQLTRVQLGFQHGSGHLRWPWGTVLFLNATFTDKHC